MSKISSLGLTAMLLGLSACQQSEAQPEVPRPAQLPELAAGANTVLAAPLTVTEGLEAIVQDAVFLPDAELPLHYHPGDETLYMIEGTVVLEQDGFEPITLTAGQAHTMPTGLRHKAKAGPLGARAVIFRAHPEGEQVLYLATASEEDP